MERLTSSALEAKFPKLHAGNYQICSPKNTRYNCMAYGNGDERHWWEHPDDAGYGGRFYWPQGIPNTPQGWVAIFTAQGYETTDNYEVEAGFEKVAIYVEYGDLSSPSHIAISDGHVWKSKLGGGHDIEHHSLDLLEGTEGDEYGIVDTVLKRVINQ